MNESDCWPTAYQHIANGELKKAIELCEREPCSGSVECQRFLGWEFYKKNDMDSALIWFSKAAQQGDPDAAFGIGSAHFARREFDLALLYYDQAAGLGYARAYGWIGYIYQLGLGVPRDIGKATQYYRKSAEHGYLLAERALIYLTFRHGNTLSKVLAVPKFIYILAKAVILAYRNINDERLRDIPNPLRNKR